VYTEYWWGDLMGRGHLKGLHVDRKIIIKRGSTGERQDRSGSGEGQVEGTCECGN